MSTTIDRVAMPLRRSVLALTMGTAAMFAATSSNAEPRELDVDLSHTVVMWEIAHGGFSNVIGIFRKINYVDIVFDPEDVSNSSVSASVEAASLDSNHYYRDNYTRSDTFLDAREYKDITFESTEITQTGDNTGTMTGDLTMRDVTQPVTFDVTFNKSGEHLSGEYMIDGFTATTTINRSDFGMDAFIPWVADEVRIRIETEGHFAKESDD